MKEQQSRQPRIFLPINGCLWTAVLIALLAISVKECKRANIRLKTDKIKYEQLMDSIQRQRS